VYVDEDLKGKLLSDGGEVPIERLVDAQHGSVPFCQQRQVARAESVCAHARERQRETERERGREGERERGRERESESARAREREREVRCSGFASTGRPVLTLSMRH
jgi:hypothetical protein